MHTDSRSRSPVALTFDDGPDPVWTPLVLDALASAGAHATFFIVVPRAKRYPSLISRMRERGQDVAFHCSKHFRHDAMTQGDRSRRGVRNHGARSVRYWRTPWGLITPATEEVANKHRLVGWTADTEDWRGGTPEEMLARVSGRISPGAIVLMHDGIGPGARRDGCAATVDLVRPLVALVRSYGLEPAALDELRHPLPDRNPDFQARGVEWENGVRVLFARVICSFKVMSR